MTNQRSRVVRRSWSEYILSKVNKLIEGFEKGNIKLNSASMMRILIKTKLLNLARKSVSTPMTTVSVVMWTGSDYWS